MSERYKKWFEKINFAKILGRVSLGLFVFNIIISFFNLPISLAVTVPLNAVVLFLFFSHYTVTQNLSQYVVKRVIGAFFTLFIISSLTFGLLRVLPGGPFDQDKALSPEVMANIEAKYHLDKPFVTQYLYYLGGLVRGDLGESYKYLGRPVTAIIKDTLPNTVQLGLYALIVCFILGIPMGLIAAAKHNTWVDSCIMIFAISGVTLPSFLVAALLILFFSISWGILPAALWDGTSYYILPMIALGIRPAAIVARLTRASVLDVIYSDYIRTAKAKGLSQKVILFKHVLKNSLIPVLTFSGPLVSGILTGSFITEYIFAIPGMGKHLIQSVSNRDYPLILGMTLIFSVVLVFANLIVDLLYSFFDPRIKVS